jgi:RecA/RadA recombinase
MAKKKVEEQQIGNYIISEEPLDFISTGCKLLDCTIGGGFPLRRISNIVGDKSSNKTGITVEVMANFRKKYPKGKIWYHEAESAFDLSYAKELGMPIDENTFIIEDIETVDGLHKQIYEAIDIINKAEVPGLYILDTLDAIKDNPTTEMSEGYDAARRAALINSLVTTLKGDIKRSNMHLMFVSQIRENIGAGLFGDKYRRSGGKALDFYASQVIWLAVKDKIKQVYKGQTLVSGIHIKASVKKNKIGLPFRTCEFPVLFYYGIHDTLASLEWLKDIKGGLEELNIPAKDIKEYADKIRDTKDIDTKEKIDAMVEKYWNEINQEFLPKIKKYE